MKLELNAHDGHSYRPPLFSQLERYNGELFYHERKLGHPLSISTHSWLAVEHALERVLDKFTAMDSEFSHSKKTALHSKTCRDLLDAHREFIYRAAEFLETIVDKVPACFTPMEKKTGLRQSAKEIRRHVDVICNKLKHEQNRMVPVASYWQTGTVLGYCVCTTDASDTLGPSRIIHRDRRGFSFGVDIRRVLADVYCIAAKVGRFIDKLEAPKSEVVINGNEGIKRLELLSRVEFLPTHVFRFERSGHMPIWKIKDQGLLIGSQGGDVIRAPISATMMTTFAGDGVIRKFEVP